MPSSTTPTQQGGPGAVRRWIALLDAAEEAIYQVDPADPVAQRTRWSSHRVAVCLRASDDARGAPTRT